MRTSEQEEPEEGIQCKCQYGRGKGWKDGEEQRKGMDAMTDVNKLPVRSKLS